MRTLADRAAPARLGRIGFAGTALLHGLLLGTLVMAGRGRTRSSPLPAYRVELVAAPRASGTAAAAAPGPAPPAPVSAAATARPESGKAPGPAPERPRPSATRAPAPVPAAPPAPIAARGPQPAPSPRAPSAAANAAPPAGPPLVSPNTNAAPGTGNAAATIRTEGVEFPFPGYLRNLVAQVYRRWHPPSGNADLEAEMLFFVHRDGTVTGVQFVTRSGSFAFDLEAQGAVEAAARSGAFGSLPPGFGPDVLPVSFFFSPRALR